MSLISLWKHQSMTILVEGVKEDIKHHFLQNQVIQEWSSTQHWRYHLTKN